jgi:hypothetical protein
MISELFKKNGIGINDGPQMRNQTRRKGLRSGENGCVALILAETYLCWPGEPASETDSKFLQVAQGRRRDFGECVIKLGNYSGVPIAESQV